MKAMPEEKPNLSIISTLNPSAFDYSRLQVNRVDKISCINLPVDKRSLSRRQCLLYLQSFVRHSG